MFVFYCFTYVMFFSFENKRIEWYSKKSLFLIYWAPLDFSFEFTFIVITKCDFRESALIFILYSGQVKRKKVFGDKSLFHYCIKHRKDIFRSLLWMSKTNDGLKVIASENSFCFFNITKLKIFKMDCVLTFSKSDIVYVVMSFYFSRTKDGMSFLICFLACRRSFIVIGSLFFKSDICRAVKNICVG